MENEMKSNNTLITMALVMLALAVLVSAVYWDDVSPAIKIGMYSFGFATGVAAGALISRRQKWS